MAVDDADDIPSAFDDNEVTIPLNVDNHPAEAADVVIERTVLHLIKKANDAAEEDDDEVAVAHLLLAAELDGRLTSPADFPLDPEKAADIPIDVDPEKDANALLASARNCLRESLGGLDDPDFIEHIVGLQKELDARITGGDD